MGRLTSVACTRAVHLGRLWPLKRTIYSVLEQASVTCLVVVSAKELQTSLSFPTRTYPNDCFMKICTCALNKPAATVKSTPTLVEMNLCALHLKRVPLYDKFCTFDLTALLN